MTEIAPHQHDWMLYQPNRHEPPQVIANSSCTICGLTPEAVANAATIKTLLDEVERSREIVRAVANFDESNCSDGAYRCHWCGAMYDGIGDKPTPHTADCPILKARAILGQ